MNSRSRKIVWTVVIFTALAIAAIVTFFILKNKPSDPNSQNQTQQQTQTTTPKNQGSVEEEKVDCTKTPEDATCKDQGQTETDKTTYVEENTKAQVQNEGSNPNDSATLTGVITRVDAVDGKLTLRVNIDQYLTSGICELTLKNGANVYTETANITDSASTSTCEGFDIPTGKLATTGAWEISIKISSGEKAGMISGKVNI